MRRLLILPALAAAVLLLAGFAAGGNPLFAQESDFQEDEFQDPAFQDPPLDDPFPGGYDENAFPQPTAEERAAGVIGGIVLGVIGLVCALVFGLGICALCFWKVFQKAGKPGWASIVPIYQTFVLIDIAGRPAWWFLLLLIPCIGIVPAVIINLDIARKFGQETIFGVGLAFLGIIFYPILGFGSARYNPAA